MRGTLGLDWAITVPSGADDVPARRMQALHVIVASMKATRVFLVVILSALPSFSAQSGTADVTVTEDGKYLVRITRETCLNYVPHEPREDVAYQAGVDINGDPVAPADLNGGTRIELPERISIPIEVDILDDRRLGDDADASGKPLIGNAQVGTVDVEIESGDATINGQPLRNESQRRLARRCQELLREDQRSAD